jgi:uncharacterized protein YgiB involved in biofilm formation
MKIELTKKQKTITLIAIAVAIIFLVWGCETAPKSEVKIDSTEVKVDTLKVDTIGKD